MGKQKEINTCETCSHWYPNKFPDSKRDVFENCENPLMDFEREDSYIQAGGFDGYGDYFKTSAKFGCILYKKIE